MIGFGFGSFSASNAATLPRTPVFFPCDVPPDQPNDERLSSLGIPLALPYEVESLAEMDSRLELIVCRLAECVKAKDWIVGFRWWAQELAVCVITVPSDVADLADGRVWGSP